MSSTQCDVSSLCTEMSLYSAKNLFGEQNQLTLFDSYIDSLEKSFDPLIKGSVGRFGIDITEYQCRVLEAILKAFTNTSFEGNVHHVSKDRYLDNTEDSSLEGMCKYLDKIPKIRITQAELLQYLGIGRTSISSISRAIEALHELNDKHFSFYYERRAQDGNGNLLSDSKGRPIIEEVTGKGPLMTVLEVAHSGSGRLDYYEIIPNPIFLDQRETYCMLIPSNWRDEVQKLLGKKKTSQTTFMFLIFLRYAFELFKRRGERAPYQLRMSPEEVASILKIHESVIKRQKKRTVSYLVNAYETAKRLGYLKDFKVDKYLHVLTLDESKYVTKHISN